MDRYVQRVVDGVEKYESPRILQGISGELASIEGEETMVPVSELTAVEPSVNQPLATRKALPLNPFYKPAQTDGPRIEFPLPDGNMIEIRLAKRVSKKVFEKIKQLVNLSEDSLVEQAAEQH